MSAVAWPPFYPHALLKHEINHKWLHHKCRKILKKINSGCSEGIVKEFRHIAIFVMEFRHNFPSQYTHFLETDRLFSQNTRHNDALTQKLRRNSFTICYDFYKKMPVKYSLAFESWNLNMKILTDFSIINSITNLVSRSQFFCDRIIPSRGDFRHNCNRPVTIHKLICDQWNFDRQISVINFITISEFSSQLWYFSVKIDTFYCSHMYKSLVAPLSSTFTKYIQIVAHINHYNLLISALTYITE